MAKNIGHSVLVSFKGYGTHDSKVLKRALQATASYVAFSKLSSVYRVFGISNRNKTIHDLRSQASFSALTVVGMGLTELTAKELLDKMKGIEAEFRAGVLHRSVSIHLLAYDDSTLMTPEVTLPHPEFHTQPENLVLAAEVWGNYHHPVLNKTLVELAKAVTGETWGEFYTQGKSLLDF